MQLLSTYRGLLDNGRLTRLLVGEFVSSIGDWLYLVALLVVVYDQAESPVVLGIVGAARVVPYILLSVPAGVVADRFDRRVVLIGTDLARGVLMLVLAGLVATNGPLSVIVAVTILAACFSAFFGPAIGSFLPTIVADESQLGPANSAWATLDNLAFVIGPAVAGILIAAGGLPAAFLLNAFSFAFVALILWRLPSGTSGSGPRDGTAEKPDDAAEETDGEPSGSIGRDAGGPLVGLAVINAVAGFVFGGLGVITVVLAVDVLRGGDAATGYLNAAIGVGGIVGAAGSAVIVLRRRLVMPLVAGGLTLAGGLFVLGYSSSMAPALAALAVASAGSLVVEVVSTTVFQRVVPDRVRGRALGVMETVGVGAYAAGAFSLPIAVAALGVQPVLAAGAIAVAVAVLIGGALVRTGRAVEAATAQPGAARLLAIPIFAGLPVPRLDAAARRLEAFPVRAAQTVIAQGDPADRFYVIDEGSFVVTQRDGGADRKLRRMGPGEVFGEIGLLTGSPRTATVTAESDGRLLALGRDSFLELVGSGPGLTSRLLDLHRGATVS